MSCCSLRLNACHPEPVEGWFDKLTMTIRIYEIKNQPQTTTGLKQKTPDRSGVLNASETYCFFGAGLVAGAFGGLK